MCEICFSRFYGYINSLITKIKESTVFNLLINLTLDILLGVSMLGFKYVYWCVVTTCFIFFPFFLFYLMVVQVHLKVTEHTVISVYYFILTKHYRILWTKCSIVSGSALAKSPQVIIMLFQFDTCIYALLMISRSQFMIENWEKRACFCQWR